MTPKEQEIHLRIRWLLTQKEATISDGNSMIGRGGYWTYDIMGVCHALDNEISILFNELEKEQP
jgi:hypothetical protein